MNAGYAPCALVLALVCFTNARVDIPQSLKEGKMRQYAACRDLFDQDVNSSAVVTEPLSGPFKKVCNCSFSRNPPQSGLALNCEITREVVFTIDRSTYEHLKNIANFIVRYAKSGTDEELNEKLIAFSSNPEVRLDLDYDRIAANIYDIWIYAFVSGHELELYQDQISTATGLSVRSENLRAPRPSQDTRSRTLSQNTQSFSMDFLEITDTTMEIVFNTDTKDFFRVEYVGGGVRRDLIFDEDGKAELTGLQPETEYTFIISYNSGGQQVELKRHNVETRPRQRFVIQAPNVRVPADRDISLECPVITNAEVQTISWYKVSDGGRNQLLATYDEQSGETSYPAGRDPKIEVIEGRVLKINNAGAEDAGRYRCRYSILGTGYQWSRVRIAEPVFAYITWHRYPGVTEYYIQYRPETDVSGQWKWVTLNTEDTRARINDLQPLTSYVFEIFDYSGGTRGDMIDTLTVKTNTSSSQAERPSCDDYLCGRGYCDPNPSPHCVCDYGFTGPRCNTVVNFCESEPCQNGGICSPARNGYRCRCRGGFSGTDCERARTPCNPNPCENDGICVTAPGGYVCRCKTGFRGSRCDIVEQVNPCDDSPCLHGTCTVSGSNYHCECERGFYDRNCDQIDTAPSILLQCPIDEGSYGSPELIQWIRVSGSTQKPIYSYDIVNRRRDRGISAEYRGRLGSPTVDSLLIRNAKSSDVGTYLCVVHYRTRTDESPMMRLVQLPPGETRVTMTWRPSRYYLDRYILRYRNVNSDDDFTEVRIPFGSTRYTLTNLEPNDVYEVYVIPSRTDGLSEPVDFEYISSDAPTTTPTTTIATTRAPSRGDSDSEKPIDDLSVTVLSSPLGPFAIGSTIILNCRFRNFRGARPTITWQKLNRGRPQETYGPDSRDRIRTVNQRYLRVTNFQQSDVGVYQCSVEYNLRTTIKQGDGEIVVNALQDIPRPTNFIADVTGPNTAVITWQPPRYRGRITNYVIQYYPTTRRFGEYQRTETVRPSLVLRDLEQGREYNVEIRASDGRRYSEPLRGYFEQEVERIPSPVNFQAQMVSKTQARISWNQPSKAGITGYKVQYWDVSKPQAGNVVEDTTRSEEMTLSNLVDDVVYQVSIVALKGDSESPRLSGQFTKTTPDKPNPPSSIRFKDVESDQVTAFWDTPTGWTPSTKYRVLVRSLNQDSPFSTSYPDSAPNMRTITALKPGVAYLITVHSVRNRVLSEAAYGTIKTNDVITLSAPYPPQLTLRCNARITANLYEVQWYKIDSAEQSKLIFTFRSTSRGNQSIYNPADTQFTGRLSAPSLTEMQIENVRYPADFGKYKCIARSVSRTGSDIIELVAKFPARIEPPYSFESRFINDTTVKISWLHPYAEDITSYRVQYWPTSAHLGSRKELEVTATEATLYDILPGAEYGVEIKSKIISRLSDDSLTGQFINFAKHVTNVRVERLPDGNDLRISWENPVGIDGIQLAHRRSELNRWTEERPMSPDTTSRRFRYLLRDGESVQFRLSALKNNVPTPVVITYTERDIVEIEETKEAPEVSRPIGTDRTSGGGGGGVAFPSPVSNLQLESPSPNKLSAKWDPTPDVHFDFYRVKIVTQSNEAFEVFNITRSYIEVELESGQTYEVSVSTARNGAFSYPVSGVVKLGHGSEVVPDDDLPLPAPTDVRFSSIMRARFTVTWNYSEPEVNAFEVRYRPSGDGSSWLTTRTSGRKTMVIREVNENTEYTVQVIAVTDDRRSEPAQRTVRTKASRRRRPMQTKVNVIEKTNDTITLRLQRSDARHEITVIPVGGSGKRQILNTDSGVTKLVVENLQPGKRYRIIVDPVSSGRSRSTYVYPTTNPNQPTNLEVSALGSELITLTWDEPESTLTSGYRVIYFPVETNAMEVLDITTNRVEITDLQPGTEYTVQVRTKQGNDVSSPTSITVTTPETVSAPSNAEATVIGDDIQVRWTPVTGAEYYEVTYYPEDDDSIAITERVNNPTSFTRIPDLLPSHYVIRVSAVKDGQKSPSTVLTKLMPVEPPQNLRISQLRSDGLTATWTAPRTPGYTPTYDVVAQLTGVITPLELPSEKRTRSTTYTFNRLQPSTEYRVQVISRYGELKSVPISRVVTTRDKEIPALDNLRSAVTDEGIVLNWTPIEGVDEYEISYRPVGYGSNPIIFVVPSGNSSYTVPKPEPGQYEFSVLALEGERKGPVTKILVTTGIESVTEVDFSDVTEDSVIVQWLPPSTRALYNYEVKLTPADDDDGSPNTTNTRQNWVLVENLKPATEYVAEVTAVLGDRRSEPMSSSITTGVPVSRVVNVPDSPDGNVPVEITWEAVPDADNYTVTYYATGERAKILNIDGARNSITLNNLEPETRYVVEVKAVINEIEGSPKVATFNTGPIASPDELESEPSNGVMRLSWNPVDNVEHYEITYHPVRDSRNTVTRVVTSPFYVIRGVEPDDYEITVTAITPGHRSAPTTIVRTIGVLPPDELEFTDATENEAVVIWERSPTRDVINYEVRVTSADDLTKEPIIVVTNDTFVTLTNLEPGTTYVVEIIAKTEDQESEPVVGSVTTEVPSPQNFGQEILDEEGTIRINWDVVPDSTSYTVTYYAVGSQERSTITVDGADSGTVLEDLLPDTEYVVEVTSLVNDIDSQPTVTRLVTPLEKPKKAHAEPLSQDNKESPTSIELTWDEENAAPVYEIRYFPRDQDTFGEIQTITVSGTNGSTILSDLLPATEYVIEIIAVDGSKSSRPERITVTTPLDEPEITVTEPEEDEVTLTWERPTGEVSEYTVELTPVDGSRVIRVPVDGRRNSVTVTGLQPDTEYDVRVIAINNEKSVQSQPVVNRIETKPADVKPVNVDVDTLPNGTYVITWNSPARQVTYYVVHYEATDDTPSENTIQVAPDLNELVLPELVPGKDYDIYVQGVLKPTDGTTAHNTVARRITTGIPALPDSVTTGEVTDQSIVITWDAPIQEKYLTGYRVEVYPEGSNTAIKAVDVPRSTTTTTFTGLSPNTNYVVRVTPHINFRPGESATQTVLTDEIRTVPSPDSITVSETTPEDVVIQWQPPRNHDLITRYEVIVTNDDGDVVFNRNLPGDTTTYTIQDLSPSTSYNVQVTPFIGERSGEPVEEIAFTLPEEPGPVTVSNLLPNQVELSWAPSDGEAISYFVNVEPLDNFDAEGLFFETEQPSILVPELLPETTYRIEIFAVSPNSQESYPSTTEITTPAQPEERTPAPDIKPEGSISFVPNQPEILISWDALEDQSVESYQVLYRSQNQSTQIITVPSSVNEVIVSPLEPTDTYDVWIRALLPFGDNVPVRVADKHTVTIIPQDNYSPLTDEPVTVPEDGKISVNWESAGPEVILYGVTYTNTDTGEENQIVVPGASSETLLSGLNPGDQYVIVVTGLANGLPVQVDTVNVGTSDFVPDENSVQQISATGNFTVEWEPDADNPDTERFIAYTVIFERKCCLGEPDMVSARPEDRFVILELEPNTEYVFRVEGKTSDGVDMPIRDVVVSERTPERPVQPILPRPDDRHPSIIGEAVTLPDLPDDSEDEVTFSPTVSIATRPRPRPVPTMPSRPDPLGHKPRSRPAATTRETTTSTTEPTPPAATETSTEFGVLPLDLERMYTPTDGKISISWEPFFGTDDDGNYRVSLTRPDRLDETVEAVLPSEAENVTFSMLEPYVNYVINLEASVAEDEIFLHPFNVNDDTLPRLHPYQWLPKTRITSIEPYGENAAIIKWTTPEPHLRKVTHYILEIVPKDLSSTDTTKIVLPADKKPTSHVITGLTPGEEYRVKIHSVNEPTKSRSTSHYQFFRYGDTDEVTSTTPVRRTRPVRPTTSLHTVRPIAPILTRPVSVHTRPQPTELTPASSRTAPATRPERPITPLLNRPVVRTRPQSPDLGPVFSRTTPAPHGGNVRENTTPAPDAEDLPSVDALPTFDGNVIINWTPAKNPVQQYILEYTPRDGSSPSRNITIPGDISWTSIPEPTTQSGYTITIYTFDDTAEPLYNAQLGTSPTTGGFRLNFKPVSGGDRHTTVTETVTTQEVFIPGTRVQSILPDNEYTLNTGEESVVTDEEYVHWLQPIRRQDTGPRTVTLRWNPETVTETTEAHRYRIELVPINDPLNRTIVRYLPSNRPGVITGLKPGVSYRLYAKYMTNGDSYSAGDIATQFVVPAFTSRGAPINSRRFGVNEVWMKELLSGDLLLQWENYPEATSYTIEYRESPNGALQTSSHDINSRWIVLPRLPPGSNYTINIYAMLRGSRVRIYTVTVKRKVTAPQPPSKIEWYNMYGDKVDLAWIPPPTRITGYRITHKLENDTMEFVVDLPASATTYRLTDLVPGGTYIITIQTLRDEEISRAFTFRLIMNVPTVRKISFRQTAPETVVVTWPALPDYVTGYFVRVKQVSPPGPDLIQGDVLGPDQLSYTIRGVKPSTRYEFSIVTLIDQKRSIPVTLQLWTLRQESQVSRVEQTGTWTVTWSGDPHSVDHWKIEVRARGSERVLYVDDEIDPFVLSYNLRGLTPGQEYIASIYGIKDDVVSSPIQLLIPANPQVVSTGGGQNRAPIRPSGAQLIERLTVRRRPDTIEINLFPVTTVGRYNIKYKTPDMADYTTLGVEVEFGDEFDTATVRDLEPGQSYEFSITAIKGSDRSTMIVNIGTPTRTAVKPPLHPVQNIVRERADATGFYIRWDQPTVPIQYYTITYTYTETGRTTTRKVTIPSIHVKNIASGHSATYKIGYMATDGRRSPNAILKISFENSRSSRPNTLGSEDHLGDDFEQP